MQVVQSPPPLPPPPAPAPPPSLPPLGHALPSIPESADDDDDDDGDSASPISRQAVTRQAVNATQQLLFRLTSRFGMRGTRRKDSTRRGASARTTRHIGSHRKPRASSRAATTNAARRVARAALRASARCSLGLARSAFRSAAFTPSVSWNWMVYVPERTCSVERRRSNRCRARCCHFPRAELAVDAIRPGHDEIASLVAHPRPRERSAIGIARKVVARLGTGTGIRRA